MANFWKGKDSTLLFTFEEQKLILTAVDWEVGIVGEDIEDDIIGEDRARLDFVASHYSVTLNLKMEKTEQLAAFVASQKSRDARALPKQSSMGILIRQDGGTRQAYQCREYILGQWKLNGSGRKERNKLSVPGRCRYFDVLPTT